MLDALLDLPSEQGDLTLGETIRAAGGKTTNEGEGEGEPYQAAEQPMNPVITNNPLARPQISSLLMEVVIWFLILGPQPNHDKLLPDHKISKIQGALTVVATLIATITFQSGLLSKMHGIVRNIKYLSHPCFIFANSNDVCKL